MALRSPARSISAATMRYSSNKALSTPLYTRWSGMDGLKANGRSRRVSAHGKCILSPRRARPNWNAECRHGGYLPMPWRALWGESAVNNPPERECSVEETPAAQMHCGARVEDFLDNLCAPLIGIVPYGERNGFRQEAHAHIEALFREFLYQGKTRQAALEAALHEFGEPWQIGNAFLQEWSQGTPELMQG